MDVVEDCLTKSINSNNFPAKLWRLVNNPVNEAIFWDKDGLVVVIDQILVEQQVLSSRNSSSTSNNADTFQTANFSSFVRNLNLYGFKKSDTYDDVQYHYYYHPNFKRDHPELVASLRRLTGVNKAKLEAGLKVNPRPPSQYHRYSEGCGGGDKDDQIGNHSLPSTPHRKFAHPYCPNQAPAVTAHNGTPVPPQFLTWGRGAALSPTVFATDKEIPVTPSQHYAGAASSSNAMLIQQSLLPRSNHGNPNFTFNAQNQRGYYIPCTSMDVVEDCLTKSINPNNFPAKLWRLVNNPVKKAIFWDKDGLVVVIDQILVEQQVLSSRNSSSASNNADTFQTANFSSFVRNLNLYGFKKPDTYDDVQYHYYYHPNFKRDHPELVASLRRLTGVNKAKLEAGLKVNPRPPSQYHRYSEGCGGGDKDGQIVYQCYHPNLVTSQMAGDGLQKGSYPTHSHYQASCPVNVLSHVDRNQDSKNKEHQQVEKCDINFDTMFQIAEEVMQTPANRSLARVVAPVKPGPVSLPFSIKTENHVRARKAKHLSPGPIVVSVRGRADLPAFKQLEGSVISPPE